MAFWNAARRFGRVYKADARGMPDHGGVQVIDFLEAPLPWIDDRPEFGQSSMKESS
ncbi:MAG: hypothetical protein KJ011_07070 [Burkholderiaceae bacterium]|nr:hypothetical protein [Burkholderiaceae bacterium]